MPNGTYGGVRGELNLPYSIGILRAAHVQAPALCKYFITVKDAAASEKNRKRCNKIVDIIDETWYVTTTR